MYQAIIIIHVLLGLSIIGLVLMQQGKGADAGAAFGTGASGSVFGAQGAASFLSRTTAILATLFFTTSLGLAVFNSHRGGVADIMSGAADEKESVTVPKVESVKVDSMIPAASQQATETVPAGPVPAPADTTDQPTVKMPVAETASKDAAPVPEPIKQEPKKESAKK